MFSDRKSVLSGRHPYIELQSDFDCIYLDFAKIFDRVSLHKLINNMFYYGLVIFITHKAKSNV